MQKIYIFLLVAIVISILTGVGIYLTIKNKKKTLYSCNNNTCVEDINGKYNSLNDCTYECPSNITNEKFGSFSIGAALKTPIIYNYGDADGSVDYEGVG